VSPDSKAEWATLRLWGPPDAISLLRVPSPIVAGTGTVT
jgi:hypothetical protein